MTEHDITPRIQAELATLKLEEATLNHKYKTIYHFSDFNLLPDIERVRKRRVELEGALRILEEFKSV
jgi:hypothetical protein